MKEKGIVMLIVVAAICVFVGCGKEGGNVPMGRYVESEMSVPKAADTKNFYGGEIMLSDDGRLMMADYMTGIYASDDGGKNWEKQNATWFDEAAAMGYISSASLSSDGCAAVMYMDTAGVGDDDDTESEGNSGSVEDAMADIVTRCFWVDRKGGKHTINYDNEGDMYKSLTRFWFDREGNLFAGDYGMNIYEVDKDSGNLRKLFDTEDIRLADNLCFSEKYIFAFGRLGALVYDREAGDFADNTVLNDFITEHQAINSINMSGGGHGLISCTGPDGEIYIGIKDGLFRYDAKSDTIEQVIDGAFSSFGDPSSPKYDMTCLKDGGFAVLFGGDKVKLCNYLFDKNIPAVPKESVTVYSLWDNYSMRQAIASYQKKNPGTFIRYEIGLSGDDSVTREDAVKLLNTKLMSDDHPDIIVLDGLPADAYKGKGALEDVSGLIDEEIFENIKNACREDGGAIYALPMRVRIPVVSGKREDIKDISDVKSLADAMVRLRSENQNGRIMGYRYEGELLYLLSLIGKDEWVLSDRSLDREAVTEFITLAKRIADAEKAGYTAESLKEYDDPVEGAFSPQTISESVSWQMMEFIVDSRKLALGMICQVDFDYNLVMAVLKEKGDIDFTLFEGENGPVFVPCCMAAVVSASAEDERVLEFYRYLFSCEAQNENEDGLPINVAAFEMLANCPYDDDGGLSCASTDEDGNYIQLGVSWPNAEEFGRLRSIMESVGSVSMEDDTLGEIIRTEGTKALSESISAEDAVDEICRKMEIYLAE